MLESFKSQDKEKNKTAMTNNIINRYDLNNISVGVRQSLCFRDNGWGQG